MAGNTITFELNSADFSFSGNGDTPIVGTTATSNYRLTWQVNDTSYVVNHTPNPAIADAEPDGIHMQRLASSQEYVNFTFQDADAGWSFAVTNNNRDHVFQLAINNDYGVHTVGVDFPRFGNTISDWFTFWDSSINGYGFDLAVKNDISFHLVISSHGSNMELDYADGHGVITLYGTDHIDILTPQEGLWTEANRWESAVDLIHEGMFHSMREFDEQFPAILAADHLCIDALF